ncbi:hypothetical protein GW17_00009126 [Ensete ventricosum]|nr:hypothetical protein GW17_00009126 [Ensete ventricosum]
MRVGLVDVRTTAYGHGRRVTSTNTFLSLSTQVNNWRRQGPGRRDCSRSRRDRRSGDLPSTPRSLDRVLRRIPSPLRPPSNARRQLLPWRGLAARSRGANMGIGEFEAEGDGGEEDEMSVKEREVSVNGLSIKTSEVEAKLDDGNIQEAESSLREGLSLNYEVRDLSRPVSWFSV